MKLLSCIFIVALFAMTSPSRLAHQQAVQSGEASTAASPAAIESLLQAHGELNAISAINSYSLLMTKIVETVPPRFFVQKVRLSLEGNKIRRETTDPRNERTRVELIDDSGRFHSVTTIRDETKGTRSTPLSEDAQRESVFRANVAVTSLIPFLKSFSDPAASAYHLGRDNGDMDKYLITAAGRQFIVLLDQNRLISRVQIGRNTFEFADFKQVGSLRLPFVERVFVGNRQIFEFFFSEFEINATFEDQHFSRVGL
jgi:hypothetical protein